MMTTRIGFLSAAIGLCAIGPPGNAADQAATAIPAVAGEDAYASTYVAPAEPPFAIAHARLLTAAGPIIEDGTIVIRQGKIADVGKIKLPIGIRIIDARGRYVTPGLVDLHSHVGVMPAVGLEGAFDLTESSRLNAADTWVEHGIWPQDPQFPMVLAGGVTTIQVLPGSANAFSGRSVVLKLVPSATVQGMKFPGARQGLKMACGENPKRLHAKDLTSRSGLFALFRDAFTRARRYRADWDRWNQTHTGKMPDRDLALDTLAEVLRGNISPQIHCYRSDDMANMIALSHEFGFKIGAFHHAVEGYKIAPLLAREKIGVAAWADLGGFKAEALDSIPANVAIMERAGVAPSFGSDSVNIAEMLPIEAAKVLGAAKAAGIPLGPEQAIRWITINPARILGLGDLIGTLEAGKNADLVLWSGNPFDIYTRTDQVWIDGVSRFDRAHPETNWRTDFDIGNVPSEATP